MDFITLSLEGYATLNFNIELCEAALKPIGNPTPDQWISLTAVHHCRYR